MTHENCTAPANRNFSNRFSTRFSTGAPSFLALARQIAATRKQRQSLRNLDRAALWDIGLDRAEAEREAARPLWDVPVNWRR